MITDLRRALSEWLIGRAAKVRPMRDDTDAAFLAACAEAVRAGVEGLRLTRFDIATLERDGRLYRTELAEFGESAPVLRHGPKHDRP